MSPKLMVIDNEIDICNFVKSFFEVRGFKVTCALNGDEALAKLETVPRLSADAVRRAKVHAHALFIRRPWILRSFALKFESDVTDPFYQNLHPTVRSNVEIAHNGDLDAFADWATDFESMDYLASPVAAERTKRKQNA